ncbi:MAG: SIMPL domain-containing protein [Bacteroidetes bacterium]|nr:MAG: SIMPL domain-containing protein [Bacteroidota bacterium]
MKYLLSFALLCFFSPQLFAQVWGNSSYQSRVRYEENNLAVGNNGTGADISISAKGLANVKADAFVAVFSVSQVANTPDEVHKLMKDRLNNAQEKLNAMSPQQALKIHSDMISFIALYAYEKETKIFSKDTYSEIPAGFELKKNLHIEYHRPEELDEISIILAQSEIFDLVRVDYFAQDLEKVKTELMDRALTKLGEKQAKIEKLMHLKLDTLNLSTSDAYRVVYPAESYKSYQKYATVSQYGSKSAATSGQSITLYYQPIIDKEFDFVINPLVLEPVIQVMYEVKIEVQDASYGRKNREQLILNPQGQLLPLSRP